jgi:hypothetical protein
MNITLPPEIEEALVAQARKRGTTPELLVLDSLRQRFLSPPLPEESAQDEKPGTLADFLRPHIGVLHSSEQVPGGADMSKNTGQKFVSGLVRKRDKGQL